MLSKTDIIVSSIETISIYLEIMNKATKRRMIKKPNNRTWLDPVFHKHIQTLVISKGHINKGKRMFIDTVLPIIYTRNIKSSF